MGYPHPMGEISDDHAEHAADFAYRYAEDLDIAAGEQMLKLGLADDQMGARDPERGLEHHVFFPSEREGGTVTRTGQVTIDSGVMNPALLAIGYDAQAQVAWRHTRLPDRIQAVIAHELAEHTYGDHELALIAGAETELPIGHAARELLRSMEAGWVGR